MMNGSGGKIRVLLVEDNPADARLVIEMLGDAAEEGQSPFTYEVSTAEGLAQAFESVSRAGYDAVFLDLDLPDSRGIDTFKRFYKAQPSMPIVVLTGLSDETTGLKAVQEGAQDYLVKGEVDGGILSRAILYSIERKKAAMASNLGIVDKKPGSPEPPEGLYGLVGTNPAFRHAMGLISTVARTSRTSVLITGETGTGKELAANSIHNLSSRREGPFIKLNCSAIPDTLLEAEMFGYEKGAFTDAKQCKKGLFELADGGTIFLDEIGDMDIRLQPKLLQVLENRTFRRVGGVRDMHVDVRVVAATNKDLEVMVREKRFREDLYYRLKVMVINLPPLRERKDDIIRLAESFLRENSGFSGENKKLSPECRDIFLKYRWPGNVRELKNLLEGICLLAGSSEIRAEHLPGEFLKAAREPQSQAPWGLPSDATLEEFEKNYILHILNKVNGNKTRAAEILGISRITLREKLKRWMIEND